MNESTNWVRIASVSELALQKPASFQAEGMDILLIRLGDGVHALLNYCTHLGKPLTAGRVMSGQLTCPFHGACFDIRTGAAKSSPAVMPLHRFPVRVDSGEVYIDAAHKPANMGGYFFRGATGQ